MKAVLLFLWSCVLFIFGFEELVLADLVFGMGITSKPYVFIAPALALSGILFCYPLLSYYWRKLIRLRPLTYLVHFAAFVAVIAILGLAAKEFDRSEEIRSLKHTTGNCNPHLGVLLRTRGGGIFLGDIVKAMSPSSQYVYAVIEDLCRSNKIMRHFESANPPICKKLGVEAGRNYECYKEVIRQTAPHSKAALMRYTALASQISAGEKPDSNFFASLMPKQIKDGIQAADFMLFANEIRSVPGGPEEIFEKMSEDERQKFNQRIEKIIGLNLGEPSPTLQ